MAHAIINLCMLVKSWCLVHALHGPTVSPIVLDPLYVVYVLLCLHMCEIFSVKKLRALVHMRKFVLTKNTEFSLKQIPAVI